MVYCRTLQTVVGTANGDPDNWAVPVARDLTKSKFPRKRVIYMLEWEDTGNKG